MSIGRIAAHVMLSIGMCSTMIWMVPQVAVCNRVISARQEEQERIARCEKKLEGMRDDEIEALIPILDETWVSGV